MKRGLAVVQETSVSQSVRLLRSVELRGTSSIEKRRPKPVDDGFRENYEGGESLKKNSGKRSFVLLSSA